MEFRNMKNPALLYLGPRQMRPKWGREHQGCMSRIELLNVSQPLTEIR